MKANELRINDYVLVDGMVAEVKVIDSRTGDVLVWVEDNRCKTKSDCFSRTIERCYKVHELQPIPMSTEILKICGWFLHRKGRRQTSKWWVSEDSVNYKEHYRESIIESDDKDNFWFTKGFCLKNCPFNSLHVFQNIYYLAYGRELIINPKDLCNLLQSH